MIEAPDFLPLGSVVRLQGNSKKLFIVGRALALENDQGKREYYDYSMALYPEGLVGEAVLYANHENIDEVLFEGYRDEEDVAAIKLIKEVLPKTHLERANPEPIGEW